MVTTDAEGPVRCDLRAVRPGIAGLEDRGRGHSQGLSGPLDWKAKGVASPLDPPGVQPCWQLELSSTGPISGF